MPQNEDRTREKILLAALAEFSEKGLAKTSVAEVAYRAGITRVTVYRYFPEKKELVRAAYLRVERVFQQGLAELARTPRADLESVLKQIGAGLSALPAYNVTAAFAELERLYPDVYREVQDVRETTLNDLFEHISTAARRQHLLRPNLNGPLIRAVFRELTINFFDNPRFRSLGLSGAELYQAMTDILLHGILKH